MANQTARAFGNRNIIVQASGEGHHIEVQSDLARLTLISPRLRAGSKPKRDLDLLDAGARAVPLTGRDEDLAQLRSWLQSERTISIRTVTGAGGSGKTRLAIELMFEAEAQRTASGVPLWQTGFLSQEEARRFAALQNLGSWGWQKPTLIVVDYAATMAAELRKWFQELAFSEYLDAQDEPVPPLRILLLERHAHTETGWYAGFLSGSNWESRGVEALFDPWQPGLIRPVNTVEDRQSIFLSTLKQAAELRQVKVPVLAAVSTPETTLHPQFSDVKWADPLMLMMAALAALDTGVAHALSLSRQDVAFHLAGCEQKRLSKFVPPKTEYSGELLIRMAACVTLCRGLPQMEATQMAAAESADLGLLYPEGPGALVRHLSQALNVTETGALEPIEPDLIGEAFLLKTWTGENAFRSISRSVAVSPELAISVLIRTAQDFSVKREPQPEGTQQPISEPRPVKWLELLVAESDNENLLTTFLDSLPLATLCLRPLGLKTATRLHKIHENYKEAASPETLHQQSETYARALFQLSLRQSEMGQREAALASIAESVAIRRRLAQALPDSFAPALAGALNNLSNQQSEMGQREAALASIAECVALYRGLAQALPDSFAPDLARALCILGRSLKDSDESKISLVAVAEGLGLLSPFFQAHPLVFSDLVKIMLSDYLSYCDSLNQEPDLELLQPYSSFFSDNN